LGIDPGSARVGYGLIRKRNNRLEFVKGGLLKIKSGDKGQRLLEIERDFSFLLKKTKPDLVVLERLFFMKNMKTALEVAQSRGVLTLLTIKHKIPLLEFSPSELKIAVSGYGRADKKAVAKMAAKILKIPDFKEIDDVTDAVAAAIAGAHHINLK
jgi:crossover junction endodeoxyribonuclease RuvC